MPGQCRVVARDLFDISISAMLLADDVDDRLTLNTIMHELLHTVPSCLNHNGRWKVYAEFVNRRLPQYDIKRVAKESETGIVVERKAPVYRYILRCTKCGQENRRQKETKVVVNYKRYRCGKCGCKLERIV